jgi:hypothetical protein
MRGAVAAVVAREQVAWAVVAVPCVQAVSAAPD